MRFERRHVRNVTAFNEEGAQGSDKPKTPDPKSAGPDKDGAPDPSTGSSLTPGQIAAIATGATAGVGVAAALAYRYLKKHGGADAGSSA